VCTYLPYTISYNILQPNFIRRFLHEKTIHDVHFTHFPELLPAVEMAFQFRINFRCNACGRGAGYATANGSDEDACDVRADANPYLEGTPDNDHVYEEIFDKSKLGLTNNIESLKQNNGILDSSASNEKVSNGVHCRRPVTPTAPLEEEVVNRCRTTIQNNYTLMDGASFKEDFDMCENNDPPPNYYSLDAHIPVEMENRITRDILTTCPTVNRCKSVNEDPMSRNEYISATKNQSSVPTLVDNVYSDFETIMPCQNLSDSDVFRAMPSTHRPQDGENSDSIELEPVHATSTSQDGGKCDSIELEPVHATSTSKDGAKCDSIELEPVHTTSTSPNPGDVLLCDIHSQSSHSKDSVENTITEESDNYQSIRGTAASIDSCPTDEAYPDNQLEPLTEQSALLDPSGQITHDSNSVLMGSSENEGDHLSVSG